MDLPLHNPRIPDADTDAMFPDRWSPRAFLPDAIPEHQLRALFEAARWAPSCFNEQPWLFVYAVTAADRARFLSALVEKNRAWAAAAPVLVFLLVRHSFAASGKSNRHAAFDAGAAWMSLALEARRLGLHAHAMAGFSQEKACEILGVPKADWTVLAAIAVGRRGDRAQLTPELAERETPNARKPLADVASEGRFPV